MIFLLKQWVRGLAVFWAHCLPGEGPWTYPVSPRVDVFAQHEVNLVLTMTCPVVVDLTGETPHPTPKLSEEPHWLTARRPGQLLARRVAGVTGALPAPRFLSRLQVCNCVPDKLWN